MLPGRTYTPEDVLRLLLRYKWLIVLPFVIGLGGGIAVAYRMPERYRSETLIMVTPQRISTSVLPTVFDDAIEDRLPSISDQIMSRSRLERIIQDFNLYAEERGRGVIMEDVVALMRGDINVSIEGRGKQSFRVRYESENAEMAQKVTERLASLYVEENLRDKDNLAQSTNLFLETELEAAKDRLLEQERKLEAYKKQHSGELPSQLDANQQTIQSAQVQLQAVAATVNRARERRLFSQQQIANIRAEPLPAAAAAEPGAAAGNKMVTAAMQLEAAEAALAAAKRRYTPDHPDVRALERAIADLRAKAEAEASATGTPAARPLSPAEAARQRRIRDLEGEIAIIDRQIAAAEEEERQLKATIASYEAKIRAVPTREAELVELNRDYQTLDASYKELLKKQQESQLAANVQRRQIGETFRVIDPATVPQRPFNWQNRLLAIAGGAGGGLFLGLALIGLIEYRDSSFKTEDEVLRVLGLPVLAQVPVMAPPQAAKSWWRRIAAAGAVVLAVAGSAAEAGFWRLQP